MHYQKQQLMYLTKGKNGTATVLTCGNVAPAREKVKFMGQTLQKTCDQ